MEAVNSEDSTKGRHPAVKLYLGVMLGAYGIAVLTCLICNLVIQHTLSWFYIVLFSIEGSRILHNCCNLPFDFLSFLFLIT